MTKTTTISSVHHQTSSTAMPFATPLGYKPALALTRAKLAELDRLLQGLEQALTNDDGLPGRPWFKHLIYAPGVFTGYGAKTMPGVREAIEARRWDEAGQYIAITGRALEAYCQRLDKATALLRK